jgi:hypothetical protein
LRLEYPQQFSAIDPCVGDGVAFSRLLGSSQPFRYGIEIDADRAAQAAQLGIQVVHGNTTAVHCPVESVSLIYLNPPYDFEAGQQANRRLEAVFLEHTYRWLKPKGILVLVIAQPQLPACARLLAEHFVQLRVYRLQESECVRYRQVVVLATRRSRQAHAPDSSLLEAQQRLRDLANEPALPPLTEAADFVYSLPASQPVTLINRGIPLDEVEDLLPRSTAYRQDARILIREQRSIHGRPLTPLHGGHVSLLATAGMLNGVFGRGPDRHIAHWRSVKFVDHWEETEANGTVIQHDRERFSHELSLVYADGRTQILTHGKQSDAP